MKYILCQPAIKRFQWELEVCITRLQSLGIRDIVLLFTQQNNWIPFYFKEKYHVDVHVYEDYRQDKSYIPSIKPYLWMRYLEEDSSREDESYFYLDSDVLLRDIPGVQATDDVWLASNCENYLGVDYIDGKGDGLLEGMCEAIGINPQMIREQKPVGGAQWVINKPTYEYWRKVYHDSNKLYAFLKYVKQNDNPIQIWVAEMWAQLWNVYHFGIDVQTHKDLDFSWPNDDREIYEQKKIYHNAGVQRTDTHLFFKGQYVHKTPFQEDLSFVDTNKASYEYVKAIKEVDWMPKYQVIAGFRDKEDDKEYFVGDHYPKPANKKTSDKRLKELMSKKNNAGKPLIEEVDDDE